MRAFDRAVIAASILSLASAGLNAQSVISAHSGVVNYFEGEVTVNGQAPPSKPGTFAEIKENKEITTQMGRAEVLLTPGAMLRVGENSSLRMVSNKLADTKLDFLSGSAILDQLEVAPFNSVSISYQDYVVAFPKKGVYRFDSEPAQLKVYSGDAVVTHGAESVHLTAGHEMAFTPALVSERFDPKSGDALYRWAKHRSEALAVANLSAARNAGSSFFGNSGSWYYNPYYSMYTYLPGGRGMLCDPFSMGICYYSPLGSYYYFNQPYRNYNYGNAGNYSGYTGGGGGGSAAYNSSGYYPTSSGTSSTLAGAAASSSSAARSGSSSTGSSGSTGGFSSGGFSGGSSGGFSGGGAGGGGGVSHGGGSSGGRGR
jgi:hypothetical protein